VKNISDKVVRRSLA